MGQGGSRWVKWGQEVQVGSSGPSGVKRARWDQSSVATLKRTPLDLLVEPDCVVHMCTLHMHILQYTYVHAACTYLLVEPDCVEAEGSDCTEIVA